MNWLRRAMEWMYDRSAPPRYVEASVWEDPSLPEGRRWRWQVKVEGRTVLTGSCRTRERAHTIMNDQLLRLK